MQRVISIGYLVDEKFVIDKINSVNCAQADHTNKQKCAVEIDLLIESITTLKKRGLNSTYKAVLCKTHRALLK